MKPVLQNKYYGWLVHIAVWTVVLGMPPLFPGPDRPLMTGMEYVRCLPVLLSFMIVFYTNYFVLIDRYLSARRVGMFLLCNLVLIVLLILSVHLVSHLCFPPPPDHVPGDRTWQNKVHFFTGNAFLYMMVAGISVAIRMTGNLYRAEAERQQQEHARTEAELQNLKSQLNPHFLFNTLNNIYSLIDIDADQARQCVHDLGHMLRYVLYDGSRPTVSLKSEIGFIRDYIGLMRIRLPRHVKLDVSLPENPSAAPVASLLFISLIENAFKHGVSNDRPSFIDIRISETDESLVCRIENSFFPKSASSDRSGSGIGIRNLVGRLDILYPGAYTFKYGQEGDTYVSCLEIRLSHAGQ